MVASFPLHTESGHDRRPGQARVFGRLGELRKVWIRESRESLDEGLVGERVEANHGVELSEQRDCSWGEVSCHFNKG